MPHRKRKGRRFTSASRNPFIKGGKPSLNSYTKAVREGLKLISMLKKRIGGSR